MVKRVDLEPAGELEGGSAASLAFSADGQTLVGAGGGAIYVWRDGHPRQTFGPPTDSARGAVRVVDSRAWIGPHVLDLARGEFEPRPAVQPHLGEGLGVAFEPISAEPTADGRDLLVAARYQPPRGLRRGGTYSGPTHRVLLLSASDRAVRSVLYEGGGWSDYAALTSVQAFLVAGGEKLLVWRRSDLRRLADASGHPKAIRDVSFDAAEQRLASVAADGSARLWDTAEWGTRANWQAHADACVAVRFHPRLDVLATASLDGTCRLWTPDGEQLAELALGGQGEALAFDPTGGRLAVSVAGAPPRVVLYRLGIH